VHGYDEASWETRDRARGGGIKCRLDQTGGRCTSSSSAVEALPSRRDCCAGAARKIVMLERRGIGIWQQCTIPAPGFAWHSGAEKSAFLPEIDDEYFNSLQIARRRRNFPPTSNG
jgi:hypothetical protein